MNLIHLFSFSLMLLTFSGTPIPETSTTEAPATKTEQFIPVNNNGDDNGGEYIPWRPSRRLNWDDYQCDPIRNTDAVASTSTSLGISYQLVDSKLSYHITCGFSRTKSWGLLKTDYILAHEQGHFDITEIFARKLYEALQNYEFNRKTFKSDINTIYHDIVKQKEEYQEMYDGETDHSRNHKIQYEWLEKIQKMLDESEAYSNYP